MPAGSPSCMFEEEQYQSFQAEIICLEPLYLNIHVLFSFLFPSLVFIYLHFHFQFDSQQLNPLFLSEILRPPRDCIPASPQTSRDS